MLRLLVQQRDTDLFGGLSRRAMYRKSTSRLVLGQPRKERGLYGLVE